MKKTSTLFLKLVLVFIGLLVIAFCIALGPVSVKDVNRDFLHVFITIYLSSIPFFFALYQAFKLLTYIDINKPFTDLSAKALRNIKYCGFVFGGLYTLVSPFVYYQAEIDDAPGLFAINLVFIFASVLVITFAAVLEKLVQTGLDIKSENDLTI